jgi:uncharacterized protein
MEFEWDEEKDAQNRAKRGIGLSDANMPDWARAVTECDVRRNYGETRYVVYAELKGRLHTCVYAIREGRFRIISLRKANKRKIRRYGIQRPPSFDE